MNICYMTIKTYSYIYCTHIKATKHMHTHTYVESILKTITEK